MNPEGKPSSVVHPILILNPVGSTSNLSMKDRDAYQYGRLLGSLCEETMASVRWRVGVVDTKPDNVCVAA